MEKRFNFLANWQKKIDQIETANGDELYEIASYFDHGYEMEGNVLIEINKQKAFTIYEKARKLGNIDAKVRLADFYHEGVNCKRNTQLAIELYQIGIEKGREKAAYNLATVYRNLGDYKKAFTLYKTAQNLSNTPSIELAYCHYYGLGTQINKVQAYEIFEKIAHIDEKAENYPFEIDDANYYLGLYYLEGIISKQSIEKALFYLKKANQDKDHRCAQELLLLLSQE